MMIRGIEIKPDLVMSLIPATLSIVIKSKLLAHAELSHRRSGQIMIIKCASQKEFDSAKFEYINHIKTLPNPDDRVADFECRLEDGSFSFEKMERLTESRKTREEKAAELKSELDLAKAFKKAGMKYNGPLIHLGGLR